MSETFAAMARSTTALDTPREDQTSLFQSPADLARDRSQRLAALKEKLRELAHELLFQDGVAHGKGVAFYHVRHAAEHRGWLRDDGTDFNLSFGSGLMKAAGGAVVGHTPSEHKEGHGRLVALYKLRVPEIAEDRQEPR